MATEDFQESVDIDVMSARELINHLDEMYPERCISPMDSLESAHRYAGRREVINELIFLRDQPYGPESTS